MSVTDFFPDSTVMVKGMDTSVITVGLVDDQQLVRAGFSLVLDSQDDIQVVWQAENGQQACDLSAQQPVTKKR